MEFSRLLDPDLCRDDGKDMSPGFLDCISAFFAIPDAEVLILSTLPRGAQLKFC